MRRYPVDVRIVLPVHIPFGQPDPNAKYKRHAGDDSANPVGTPVYAPASGTVTSYIYGAYHGNVVEIFDGQFYPHVFHLKSRVVVPSQKVTVGELIGYSGATGLGITGPHIHFGVSKKSITNVTSFSDFVDPLAYIKEGGSMTSEEAVELAFQLGFLRSATKNEQAYWQKLPIEKLMRSIFNDGTNDLIRKKALNYDKDIAAKDAIIAGLGNPIILKPGTIYKTLGG